MVLGFKNALKIFHSAANLVPAYRHFLKKHGVSPSQIQTLKDFQTVPFTDKKNYLYKYPRTKLFPHRKFPPMAYASSGSSGWPTFWFRGDEEEKQGGLIHEKIFRDVFLIKKNEPTLVIICFSMGVWVAGGFTLASCRELSRMGYNITSITPGIEKEDILNALRDLAPHFRHIVITGYPPFVMDVINVAVERKIKFGGKVKFLTAGDKFSEEWRDKILNLVGNKNPFHSLVSVYGSADGGVLGFETPLTIRLRRSARTNQNLYHELFGEERSLPALVQYDPDHIFFEQIGQELVLTVKTGIPLVRYNLHDTGEVIERKVPMLAIKGRTDVAVTYYALNIMPEHIKAGLDTSRVARFVTGKFLAYNKTSQDQKQQKLYIKLELAEKTKSKSNKKIMNLIRNSLVDNLIKLNIEYRKLFSILGKKAVPVLKFSNFGDKNFIPKHLRGMLNLPGKKSKMIE